jgi:hypothetical protein
MNEANRNPLGRLKVLPKKGISFLFISGSKKVIK